MSSIKENAVAYTQPTTKNIVDLEKVPVDMELQTKTVRPGEKDEFSYDFIEVEGEEYRVPKSVIKQLHALLEVEPETEFIGVSKTGKTMNDTVYFVRSMK